MSAAIKINIDTLTPQARSILDHLQHEGSITQVEAQAIYKARALTRRIKDIREAGFDIQSVWKRDHLGQRYVRYVYRGVK